MEHWHQILTDGGMGDLICCLVAVDYNITHYPNVHFQVWVPDYLLEFAKHVLPTNNNYIVRPFSKAQDKFNQNILGMTTQWCTNHTAIRTHPVDYGFHMLSDRHVYDLNEKNYLQIKPDKIPLGRFNLPEKYVVMACTGVEPVRTMPTQTANDVIDYVTEKGYTPVFLGKESNVCSKDPTTGIALAPKANVLELNYSKGLNLLNKTDLLESAKIIHGAKAYVGMDGGLTHLAGSTDSYIVCGYTASNPNHIAPIRRGSQTYKFNAIEPDTKVYNRYFQTNSSFKKGNFQRFEGWEAVRDSMTSEKFINALEKVL